MKQIKIAILNEKYHNDVFILIKHSNLVQHLTKKKFNTLFPFDHKFQSFKHLESLSIIV
jgi:propanediol utilization protein